MAKDYLLEIDGIKGESAHGVVKDAIELDSFGFGVSNRGSMASGGGGGAGKASFSDLSCYAAVSKASPLLMLACASGQHIKSAKLHVLKQGGKQEEYYTVVLADVLVTSFNSGDAPGGATAVTDSFSLSFATLKFSYKPQKPDGSLDAPVEAGWDLKASKKL